MIISAKVAMDLRNLAQSYLDKGDTRSVREILDMANETNFHFVVEGNDVIATQLPVSKVSNVY